MKPSSYQLKPTLKLKPTFSFHYGQTLDILQLSLIDVRKELMNLLKPNRWFHFSDEPIFTVLHDLVEESVVTDLYYQLHTTRTPYRSEVCNYIIESLDSHGFFSYHKEQPFPYPTQDVDEALALIQSFEPFGIACENSTDFLIRQLRKNKEELAVKLLLDLSDLVVQNNTAEITKYLGIDEDKLSQIMNRIRSYPLYPCELQSTKVQWIRPDVSVKVDFGKLSVIPAMSEIPLFVGQNQNLSAEAKVYLKQNNLVIDMINQRNLTLLQIFHALIEIQKDAFLQHAPLKSCKLSDVSALCGVHPSTISRCCRTKYYEFEGQLHSFKTLLASGNLQGKSHDEVHEEVVNLINQEDPSSPWSDDQIIQLLQSQHIQLSRRTLAKLRQKYKIPNSYQRKKGNTK